MPSTQTFTLHSVDLAGIQQLASRMIQQLPAPLTIGLVGTLGAGKTSLVQAIARAARIDAGDVTSPTFTLLQSHQGQTDRGTLRLHHLDAYRLADEDEFLELGVAELIDDPSAWTLIEWADRVESVMPVDSLWITLSVDDDPGTRTIEFVADESIAPKVQRLTVDTANPDDRD